MVIKIEPDYVKFIIFMHIWVVYHIPLYIAIERRKNVFWVIVLTYLFGWWTIIGWHIALFLALRPINGEIFTKNPKSVLIDDSLYLEQMLDAINQIKEYLKCVTKNQFKETKLLQDAVLRQFDLIESASKKVSEKITQNSDFIPWYPFIISFVTGEIDFELVWKITQTEFPLLENHISEIRNRYDIDIKTSYYRTYI